ncbi:MAG: DUF1850 domain-containing protein [Burkholderiaceae bacterium]
MAALAALAVCFVAGAIEAAVPARSFTLAWQHTVEKVLWEEDYVVAGDWLYLSGAHVRGSGAGMEPAAGAVLHDGAWHFRPAVRWSRELRLARSEFGADYRLCVEGRCVPLAALIGPPAGTVTLAPCRQ